MSSVIASPLPYELIEVIRSGNVNKVREMLSCLHDVDCTDSNGWTSLHHACYNGNLDIVRMLLVKFAADMTIRTYSNSTHLHLAVSEGKEEVAMALIKEFGCSTHIRGLAGRSLLHSACKGGSINLVRSLILEHGADIRDRDGDDNTPLHLAASFGNEEIALALIGEFGCDTNAKGHFGRSVLHSACIGGNVDLVRTLMRDYKADSNARDIDNNTPLHAAALFGKEEVAVALVREFGCSTDVRGFKGRSVLHSACGGGEVSKSLIRTLVHDFKADVSAQDDEKNTPLHVAAMFCTYKVVMALICEFGCSVMVKGQCGRSVLHSACIGGNIDLVRTLIRDYKADTNARDNDNNAPLHVAASFGKKEVAVALVNEFGCSTDVKGFLCRSVLHSACASGSTEVVKLFSTSLSPLEVDNNGDTPLHICSEIGRVGCVRVLLQTNPPLLVRNKSGKTTIDVATPEVKLLLDEYVNKNRKKEFSYDVLQNRAKKKYSDAQPITRIFVLGNPRAGKSSLIETLKKEGFWESLWRVNAPPHTAGIIPSIYNSSYYGRVLFYDFAGDPVYYSSHAAILESVHFSTVGDNVFIIVIDLQSNNAAIKEILGYWLSFIQHQNFNERKPSLIIVGSHLDIISEETVQKK